MIRRFDAAVVLAGGRSERMGIEKSLVEVEGETLIGRRLRQLDSWFDWIAVSVACAGPSPELAAALDAAAKSLGRQVAIIRDEVQFQGPLAAVAAVLARLPGDRAFFIAVDAPELDPELIEALWRAATRPGALGAVPSWAGGVEPAHAVYGKGLLGHVGALMAAGERSLQAVAMAGGVTTIDLEDPAARRGAFGERDVDLGGLFASLNTPAEVEAWKARRCGGIGRQAGEGADPCSDWSST